MNPWVNQVLRLLLPCPTQTQTLNTFEQWKNMKEQNEKRSLYKEKNNKQGMKRLIVDE